MLVDNFLAWTIFVFYILQVFKFSRGYKDHASLVLGDRFVPGSDETHFCKPTDVAVTTRGIVFVSDGYCNQRVVAFHKNGTFLKAFGQEGMAISLVELNSL